VNVIYVGDHAGRSEFHPTGETEFVLITQLRDAAVSSATPLLFRATKIKDQSGRTLLQRSIERFARSSSVRPGSWIFDTLCTRLLGWSICGALALYGIDFCCARNAMRGRGAAIVFRNLVETIATRGLQEPLSMNAPISDVWSLSKRCNLRCVHCYQDAEQYSRQEMDLDEQFEVVEQLAGAGVGVVVLSGDEPLLNRHIFTLIQRFADHDIAIALDSNGILIDRSTATELREAGINSVQISIDSISAACHDEFRGMRGAFERARDAVGNCSTHGIFTTVATTVTQQKLL